MTAFPFHVSEDQGKTIYLRDTDTTEKIQNVFTLQRQVIFRSHTTNTREKPAFTIVWPYVSQLALETKMHKANSEH